MQGNILVKTPLTTDGNSPVIGADGRQVFSESILTVAAKPVLEKRNASLPQHLKVIIEDYTGPVGVKAPNEPEIPIPDQPIKPVATPKANAES